MSQPHPPFHCWRAAHLACLAMFRRLAMPWLWNNHNRTNHDFKMKVVLPWGVYFRGVYCKGFISCLKLGAFFPWGRFLFLKHLRPPSLESTDFWCHFCKLFWTKEIGFNFGWKMFFFCVSKTRSNSWFRNVIKKCNVLTCIRTFFNQSY